MLLTSLNLRILLFAGMILIHIQVIHADWVGEAPLASNQNALIYGTTVFTAFAVGNQIFYSHRVSFWEKAKTSVGMAALATAINLGAIYVIPNTAGQVIVPVLNALQWRDDLKLVGLALGCVPAALGLGMLKIFGSPN